MAKFLDMPELGPDQSAAALRPHRLAAALALGVSLLAAATLGMSLVIAGTRAQANGELVAVFPFGTGSSDALVRVARADGIVIRGTWLGNAWHVQGQGDGFAASLREQGAVLVLPPLAAAAFAMGGCGLPMLPVGTSLAQADARR